MAESVEELERRIDELRTAVRHAVVSGDRTRADALQADLQAAERAWEYALARLVDGTDLGDGRSPLSAVPTPLAQRERQSGLLPMREQVHRALTILSVPASPKLIVEVYTAFFSTIGGSGGIADARLTYLRRDEARSFRTSPYSRPYYLCSALTADHLVPVRGLLAVSTWPLERRVLGPFSARVDLLTAAIKVAEFAMRMPENPTVRRLLWRFVTSIGGAGEAFGDVKSGALIAAAKAELDLHDDIDRSQRKAAAARAGQQLNEVEQLFGSRLRIAKETG